jgi:N-acetylmuramoyl-L-alanine amidase
MTTLGNIEYLVVHCSGTPPEDTTVDALKLDRIHKGYGWRKIGFHLVVKRDGTVQRGRVETEAGQHAEDYDDKSLAICLIGGLHASETYRRFSRYIRKPWPDYTDAQFNALRKVLNGWKSKYPKAKVVGHSELKRGRSCPCFDVGKWYERGVIMPDVQSPAAYGYATGTVL